MNSYLRLLVTLAACTILGSSLHAAQKDKKGKTSPTTSTTLVAAGSTTITAAGKFEDTTKVGPLYAASLASALSSLSSSTAAAPSSAPVVSTSTSAPMSSNTGTLTSTSALSSTIATPALTPEPLALSHPEWHEAGSKPTPTKTESSVVSADKPSVTSDTDSAHAQSATPKATDNTPKKDFSYLPNLPFNSSPDIERHTEQINALSLTQWLKDAADLHTFSHENYLEKHIDGETLTVALPTADKQRAKFGHAANELAAKAANRRAKNTVIRMSKLLKWADAYNIELNQADLTVMKQQTILQIQDALATLSLLNSKIKITPTDPSPFDLVGKVRKKESLTPPRKRSSTAPTDEHKAA